MRLIDADALEKRMEERLNALRKEFGNYDHYTDGFEEGCVAVEDAETINPESLRPKGEWELKHIGAGHYWECSVCHKNPCIYVTNGTNFCPNCGTDMRGEGNEMP